MLRLTTVMIMGATLAAAVSGEILCGDNRCTGHDCLNGAECQAQCTGEYCAYKCNGIECGSGCNGKSCAGSCNDEDCGQECTGRTCAYGCTGNRCGSKCNGVGCAYQCEGENCGQECTGDQCANYCKGSGCGAGCVGIECASGCTGTGCGLGCHGTNCAGGNNTLATDPHTTSCAAITIKRHLLANELNVSKTSEGFLKAHKAACLFDGNDPPCSWNDIAGSCGPNTTTTPAPPPKLDVGSDVSAGTNQQNSQQLSGAAMAGVAVGATALVGAVAFWFTRGPTPSRTKGNTYHKTTNGPVDLDLFNKPQ